MDKEIAKLWVEKLRSGKFSQGDSYLCANDKFCCLGVLCELYEELNPGKLKIGTYSCGNEIIAKTYNSDVSILPVEVVEWAKMRSTNGDINEFMCLAELNDKGVSFEKIADIIENQVDDL